MNPEQAGVSLKCKWMEEGATLSHPGADDVTAMMILPHLPPEKAQTQGRSEATRQRTQNPIPASDLRFTFMAFSPRDSKK